MNLINRLMRPMASVDVDDNEMQICSLMLWLITVPDNSHAFEMYSGAHARAGKLKPPCPRVCVGGLCPSRSENLE